MTQRSLTNRGIVLTSSHKRNANAGDMIEIKRKNVVRILALLTVLGVVPLFGLQANALTLERAMTWIRVGDKWDPSQMIMVRIEFKEPTSYGSDIYFGPQTARGNPVLQK